MISWLQALFFKQEMELTLVGLQNSGKTTLVNVIATGGFSEDMIPTGGFNMRKVTKGKRAKSSVFKGFKEKASGGLKKGGRPCEEQVRQYRLEEGLAPRQTLRAPSSGRPQGPRCEGLCRREEWLPRAS